MEASSLERAAGFALPRSRRLLGALGDDRLVDLVRLGSEAAFEVIYDRHHRGILAFSRHMLASREEAEDAVQHSFAQAYSAMRAGDRELQLKPWLYTIARNRCVSMLRARRPPAGELGDVPTVGLAEAVERRSDLRDLLRDMRDLPEEQRAALVLAELGDLSHAEIGAVLRCETMKVKSLVFQARAALIEARSARDTPCVEIREQLASLRGGALRRGALRRHVRRCPGCARFGEDVRRQRKLFALVLPVVPSVGLRHTVLAAFGAGGGGAGGGALGGAAVVKLAAAVAATGAALGGGVVITHQAGRHVANASAAERVVRAAPRRARPAAHAVSRPHRHAPSPAVPAERAPHPRPEAGLALEVRHHSVARRHRSRAAPPARAPRPPAVSPPSSPAPPALGGAAPKPSRPPAQTAPDASSKPLDAPVRRHHGASAHQPDLQPTPVSED
ncbi:MAG: hypothetical protein NVSMB25_08510 [Thermoleophilaceae bacterium]